jgi:hypothetical protein
MARLLPSHEHPCWGCFLEQQRGGRVCPAAREVYSLPDVEAQRHTAALHAAVLADAGRTSGFAELVRGDAVRRRAGVLSVPHPSRSALCPSSSPATHDSAKGVVHVVPSRTD